MMPGVGTFSKRACTLGHPWTIPAGRCAIVGLIPNRLDRLRLVGSAVRTDPLAGPEDRSAQRTLPKGDRSERFGMIS